MFNIKNVCFQSITCETYWQEKCGMQCYNINHDILVTMVTKWTL